MNKERLLSAFTLFIIVIILIWGCGGGGSSSSNGSGTISSEAASIGPSGGTIEVTNPSSQLFGVKLEVPPGALKTTTTITINAQEGQYLIPSNTILASKIISFGPEGTYFDIPISIRVPYSEFGINVSMAQIYRYETSNSSWNTVTLKDVDIDNNYISAYTTHFSTYAVLAIDEKNNSNIDFSSITDGLSNVNTWGDCYGMVAFVEWFWNNKRMQYGDLMNWKSISHPDIATKAQNLTINQQKNNSLDTYFYYPLSNSSIINSLIIGLLEGKPQLLVFKTPSGYHATLAYNFKKEVIMNIQYTDFYIYDPNFPGEEQILSFTKNVFDEYIVEYTVPNYKIDKMRVIAPSDIYNSENMESVFRYYKNNSQSILFTPAMSGGDYITVDGVSGTASVIVPGAEFEICGTYILNSRNSAQVIAANYAPLGSYSSTSSPQYIYSGSGYYCVGFKVLNVETGYENRIGIGFYPSEGGSQFYGSGYGCSDIFLQ